MVVDDRVGMLEQVKSYLDEDEFKVVTVSDSRQAFLMMDSEVDVDLILVKTQMPEHDSSAFFSLKPNARFNAGGDEHFLKAPFTKKQLIDFIKAKI